MLDRVEKNDSAPFLDISVIILAVSYRQKAAYLFSVLVVHSAGHIGGGINKFECGGRDKIGDKIDDKKEELCLSIGFTYR